VHCQGEGENIEIIQMGALGGVNDPHHQRADLQIIHGDMVMVCQCDDVAVLADLEKESCIPIIMCIFSFINFLKCVSCIFRFINWVETHIC
jgi:hypothetical protein